MPFDNYMKKRKDSILYVRFLYLCCELNRSS